MRLFLIASECPPVPGGIATYVGNTATMFSDAGHDITIFARSNQPGTETQGNFTLLKIAPKDVHIATGKFQPLRLKSLQIKVFGCPDFQFYDR